jgi:hypothetical protein
MTDHESLPSLAATHITDFLQRSLGGPRRAAFNRSRCRARKE